jgi:DNA-binding transcriptional LysR family regulator
MNLRFLEAFVWVARVKSFRAAAEKLNMTQSAVSSRIATLESEFGRRLFDRDPREVRLTAAGRTLLIHAERLLHDGRAMRAALMNAETIAGIVRIGAVESVVHTFLVPYVQSLNTRYPGLELELTAEPTRHLHEHLQRGVIDLALQTDTVFGDSIVNCPLCTMPMGWIASGDFEGGVERRMSLQDLASLPIITFTRGSQPHAAVIDVFRLHDQAPRAVHCVTSLAAIVRLVHSGLGIASMPLAAVAAEIAEGSLRVLTCDAELPPLPIMASYRPDPTSPTLDLVAELAVAEVRAYCDRVGTYCALPASSAL